MRPNFGHIVINDVDSDDQPPMFENTSLLLYLRPNGSDVDYAIYTCMQGYEMTQPADTVFATFAPSTRKWNFSATPQCQGQCHVNCNVTIKEKDKIRSRLHENHEGLHTTIMTAHEIDSVGFRAVCLFFFQPQTEDRRDRYLLFYMR